jgi:hypothetical protein
VTEPGRPERPAAGDVVVLRYFRRAQPVGALPTRVISGDGPALWLASGTTVKWPAVDGRPVREIGIDPVPDGSEASD